MSEKTLNNIRVINKHDLEENWLKATGFTPKQGELIVYDIDDNYSYERIKIGDGIQNVNALPFVDDTIRSELLTQIGDVDDKVDTISDLIGGETVSKQINDALLNSQSDMSQNDPTKIDYVKNRTHWKEEIGMQPLFEGTIDTEYGWNISQWTPVSIEIQTGEPYLVVYDGVTYELTGKVDTDNIPYIGSDSLWYGDDYITTEEPFCYGSGWFGASVDGTHSVVISGESIEWHTIDKEYIPGRLIFPGGGYKAEVFNDSSNSASGIYSHAEGYSTVAASPYQHVQGRYNIIDENSKYLHIVGNGNSESNRSNVHTLDWHGKAWFSGDIRVGGTNYEQGTSLIPLSTTVTLKADSWTGDSNPWSQRVKINGVKIFSKVDLQPTAMQIVELQNEDIMFMIENDFGTTTAWAIGNKPTKDYDMQVLITGVTPV